MSARPTSLPSATEALPGRSDPMPLTEPHFLWHRDLRAPTPEGMEEAIFGMGCFGGSSGSSGSLRASG